MSYHLSFDIDLKRNTYPGTYIAIEGIDGSGKTTQVEKVAAYLQSIGKDVVFTQEPKHDLLVGKIIRDALSSKIELPSVALQYLYSADRVINHETVVKPALASGKTVLSHRVFWSAVPYGLMDKIMDNDGTYDFNEAEQILVAQGILSMYHQFVVPDKTFYLTVSVDSAMERLANMHKAKEIYEKREKLEKIHKGYEMLLHRFPKEFIVINGEQSEERVTEEIINTIQNG